MDTQSATIGDLAKALAEAQAEMPAIPLNSKNPFMRAKYADLGAVISKSRPILNKHGLSITQFPISDGRNIGVKTLLLHESGEWIQEVLYLPIEDEKGLGTAQVAGKALSYLRRYAWAGVAGLYTDEDTDASLENPADKPEAKPDKKPDEPLTWVGAEDAAALMPGFDADTHKARCVDKAKGVLYGIPKSLVPEKLKPDTGEPKCLSDSELKAWVRLAEKSGTDLISWAPLSHSAVSVDAKGRLLIPRTVAPILYARLEKMAESEGGGK